MTIPVVLVALTLGPATPASAHAYLTASAPADGTTLAVAPETVRLQFSESVDLPATRIEVVDGDAHHYSATHLRIVRGDDTEEPSSVLADLPRLPRGVYRVSWETLSSDDLHRTSGTLTFGVDRVATRGAFVEPLPHAEETALRWLLFACLALTLGGLLAGRLLRLTHAGPATSRSAVRFGVVGSAAGLFVAAALLTDQVSRSGGSVARLMSGSYWPRWTVRELGLLLLLVAAMCALRGRRRIVGGLVAVGAGSFGIGSALLGHAATGSGLGATRITADALHLLAGATWSGTVGVVAILAVGHRAAVLAALRAFAVPAAACVSAIAVTGIYLASSVVGSVDAALYTWYGRALVVKVALFAVVAALGLANHRRLRRAGARTRWTLPAEAVVSALVLGLAAFLTSGQPAREPEFVTSHRPTVVPFVDGRVADLQERVRLGPNRPGRNVAVVDVLNTRRPAPGPIDRVLVRVVGDAEPSAAVVAEPLAIKGRWSATVTVPAPGRVKVEVTVLRAGLRPVRHTVSWVVAGEPATTRPARVSTAPVGGGLKMAALAVLIALGVSWLAVAERRRRRGRGGDPWQDDSRCYPPTPVADRATAAGELVPSPPA